MMKKIKVTESFYALQGEGRHVGVPSVFLRMFGCNFRCKNFGRSKDPIEGANPEVAEIIKQIPIFKAEGKKLYDLPLVATGCDSYAAVYPEFKDFSPFSTTDDLARDLLSLTPKKQFNDDCHLILTGGEPMLWARAIPELLDQIATQSQMPHMPVTIETNGTQKIDKATLNLIASKCQLHFSVSPKLSVSGESRTDAIQPDVVLDYMQAAGRLDFKFVVATQDDVLEVIDILENEFKYITPSHNFGHVYLMPVGGLNEMYQDNRAFVAEQCLAYGFKFSPRLQCDVSGNEWGT